MKKTSVLPLTAIKDETHLMAAVSRLRQMNDRKLVDIWDCRMTALGRACVKTPA